ncbi:uncharacterized protein LOC124809910 isoform X2 [Hydra vulgaris]|uniref:uncharacterized protein LOC124809910 isoform X2 n=1 Tax=Hydra vulgaris TaxID=6087 RepID=UPI0032E9F6B5
MATYSKSVLDALTENPAQLFVDFLKFLESTQPITVPSTSAIRGSFYICYLWLDTTGQEGGRLAWHMSRPLCQLIHHLYML